VTRNVNVVNIEYHVYKPCSSNIGAFTPLLPPDSSVKTLNNPPSVNRPFVSSGTIPSLIHPSTMPPSSEFQARLSNEDLCFFQAIVSCPPSQELTKLINEANMTGYIPYAYEINQVLLSPTVPENYSQRVAKLALPTVPISINPHLSIIHADNGASCSIIRESIAIQLGTPIFNLTATNVKDINDGEVSFNKVCYVQVEVPQASQMIRIVLLCLVKKDFHMPFLIGASDQRAFDIHPQLDTKRVCFGPSKQPHGSVRYLDQKEWQQSLSRNLQPLSSSQLAHENKELLRKAQLAKIYRNIEPIIEVLGSSGMHKQRLQQPKSSPKKKTQVSTEEIRQASRTAPTPLSPSAKAVHSIEHQVQLIQEPLTRKLIDNERKYDQWNSSTSVKELRAAKMNPNVTDLQLASLERLALQEGLKIYHPSSIPMDVFKKDFPKDTSTSEPSITLNVTSEPSITPIVSSEPSSISLNVSSGINTSPNDEVNMSLASDKLSPVQVSEIQEYLECLHALRGHTEEADPEILPDDYVRSSHIQTNFPAPIYSSSAQLSSDNTDSPAPDSVVTDNFSLNVLNAYLTASSPVLNKEAEDPILEILSDFELELLNSDNILPPSNHAREFIPVFSGQVKPSKFPTRPTKPSDPDDPPLVLNEEEFLDPNWIPSDKIAALNDTIYCYEKLKHLQEIEQRTRTTSIARQAEVEAELKDIVDNMCKLEGRILRPDDFPEDLWSYVLDDQKPLVADRFALFPAARRAELINELLKDLDISTKQGVKLERFMRAQAIANLDTFGYPDPYSPPTIPGYTFRIETTHDQPIYKNPTRFNQQEAAFLDARIYELVNLTKVEPAPNSPHNCPLVLVPYNDRIKASITKWIAADLNPVEQMFKPSNYKEVSQWYRLTNNLKAVNDVTVPYRYPMPDQEDPKHFTKGSRYWSSTDIKDAFFCVNLHPDDRDKTAFTTPRGRFRFTVMPQGATNSPPFFSHVAQDTFSPIPKTDLLNFIDDTTNHSKTFKQHLITQQLMYDALRSKRLIMKVSKSHFLQDSIRVLGYIFSEFGHTPDPVHMKSIMEMAPPRDQTDVRRFLGLMNFNNKYIPRFSELTGPLNDLLCKETNGQPTDVQALWKDDIHGEAFRKSKIALTSAPCMMAIDVTKPFMLHVDSCKNGRGPGAVLLQQNEEKDWRPVSYFSCRLRKGETSWSATELEAMGLVYAIRYWSSYLKVQKFTAVVDHHALIWLVTRPAKTANGRILHWISDLQEYTFDIIHRLGTQHLDADAISRLLQYSDLPQQYPDSSDLVPPVTGPVDNEMLVDVYKQMIQQRDYYLYLTSKTFLTANGITPDQVVLPEPDKRSPTSSTILPSQESELEPLPAAYEDELLFPNILPNPTVSFSNPLVSSGPAVIDNPTESEPATDNEETQLQDENLLSNLTDPVLDVSQLPPLPAGYFTDEFAGQYRPYYPEPEKRSVGRPKNREGPSPQAAVGVEIHKQTTNLTPSHKDAGDYSHLVGRIFRDPIFNRLYEVIYVTYDKHLKDIAYRKAMDDAPPHQDDLRPWPIKGYQGIDELTRLYHLTHKDVSPTSTIPSVKWPTNEADMLELQKADPNLTPIINRLIADPENKPFKYTDTKTFYLPKNEETKEFRALRLMDTRNPVPTEHDRVVLPMSLRRHLYMYYHDEVGHPGRDRTVSSIQQFYWWSGLRTDVETYVNSCTFCSTHKPNHHSGPIPIQEYPTPTYPFQITHLDLTGDGLPRTKSGNKLILVFKCSLTRYVEIVAIPAKDELVIARVLVERIYLRHGAPGIIVTDKGPEFVNQLCTQLCILLNIGRITTVAYNPRSNGLVEQHNHTLKAMLAVYCNRYQDDWDVHLPHVAFAYNTTISSATGFTPFCMLFGREARQLCNGWVDSYMEKATDKAKTSTKFKIPDYVRKTAEALQLGWDLAGSRKSTSVEYWNKKQRARLPFKEFQIGARFFLRYIPTPTAKTTSKTTLPDNEDKAVHKTAADFQARWTGPYKVTKKFSPVLYETIINGTPKRVHALHMKPDPICDTLRLNIPLEDTDPVPLPSISLLLESENPVLPVIAPANPVSNTEVPNTADSVSNAEVPSPEASAPVVSPESNVISPPLRTSFYDEVEEENKQQDPQSRIIQRLLDRSS